uniref:Putative Pollen Ole e 1 allergen and extensin family protein n=1 Tax=Davidia involucrata TaxID=16924 RepID=A0A5B7B8L8_DAVIN
MAKSNVALIASALCILALAGFAQCRLQFAQQFSVEGRIYCDTCRLQFVTRISNYISGATVRLECRDRQDGGNVTYTTEGLTGADGQYSLPVPGDHEGEICEVIAVSSPDAECNEPTLERARISLAMNSGIASENRYANYLGFLRTETLPECAEVIQELTLV